MVNCASVIYHAIKFIAAGKYIYPEPYCAGNASTKWSLRQLLDIDKWLGLISFTVKLVSEIIRAF
jgi:hypothetical protein